MRSTDISPLSVLLSRADAIADGSGEPESIPSGFASLDKLLGGGFRRGDLVVLGGDVGSGKSALALAFAIRAAVAGQRVGFFSGEMSVERVLERIIAIEGRIRIDDLRRGMLDDIARANAGAVAIRLRDTLPVIEPLPGGGVAGLAELLDEIPSGDFIVVDSLPALTAGASTRDEELASAVQRLKSIAMDRRKAVLVTAQLPNLGLRPDRRPILDDFGAMGAVKQTADVVLTIFREDMYEPGRDITGATELLVRKNRNGPIGYADLYFYAHWMRFEDMLDPDQ